MLTMDVHAGEGVLIFIISSAGSSSSTFRYSLYEIVTFCGLHQVKWMDTSLDFL